MYDLYLASGATVLIAGILTSVYLIYSLYKSSSARNLKRTAAVVLSETLVSIAIGAFYIYSYSTINEHSARRAALIAGKLVKIKLRYAVWKFKNYTVRKSYIYSNLVNFNLFKLLRLKSEYLDKINDLNIYATYEKN